MNNSNEYPLNKRLLHVRIEPPHSWQPINLKEIWQHRDLFFNLVWRDIRVQYINTGIGLLWAVLEPLTMTLILTLILGAFTRLPLQDSEIPYNLIVLSGMVCWVYFSKSISSASNSVLANFSLFSKVYLPRIILPVVPIIVGLVDLAVLLVVFIASLLFQGLAPNVRWLFIPALVVVLIIFSLGMALWISALNVPYRDIGRMLPLVLQIGFYASPVFYPFSIVQPPLKWIAMLNPMAGIISFARWLFFNQQPFPVIEFVVTLIASILLVISGAFVFRRIEDRFVDIG